MGKYKRYLHKWILIYGMFFCLFTGLVIGGWLGFNMLIVTGLLLSAGLLYGLSIALEGYDGK
jgi:hypothetical protein